MRELMKQRKNYSAYYSTNVLCPGKLNGIKGLPKNGFSLLLLVFCFVLEVKAGPQLYVDLCPRS